MHILVVDDDQAVRDSLARSLEYNDYEVSTAEDGVEALAKLAAHRPDHVEQQAGAVLERTAPPGDWDLWLFSRRNAILAGFPFAMFNAWTAYLLFLLVYAATSFFLVQKLRRALPG